ncbi:fimbrillin family protein [Bacteroides caecigallinarum]|nr:fimbrillin family protein [Bacteroides caecigallinarum]
MKLKSYYFIFAAATIMFGCSSEGVDNPEGQNNIGTPDENGMVYVEFTAGAKGELAPGNVSSRTELQGNGAVWWSANDEISVFHAYHGNIGADSNYPNYKFTRKDNNTLSESATFGGYLFSNEVNSYHCLGMYPYNEDAIMSPGGVGAAYNIQTFLNGTQYFPAGGGYDPAACLSFADLNFAATGDKVFKLGVGMIGFNFSKSQNLGERKLKSIMVGLDNNQTHSLGGKLAVGVVSDGQTDFSPTFNGMTNIIGVIPDEDISGKTYYLCVAPIPDLTLNISFILDDNTVLTKQLKVSNFGEGVSEIKKAKYYTINNISLKASDFKKSTVVNIETAEGFYNWYSGLDKNVFYGSVILKNDIDLDNYTFTAYPFNGSFDGGGHTISNFKVTPSRIPGTDYYGGGLFSRISAGVVKNLNIDTLTITIDALQGNTDSDVYLGSIAGSSVNGARIENCRLSNIIINGNNNTTRFSHILGGVVGVSDRLIMTGCRVVSLSVQQMNTIQSAGGLVGEFNAKNKLIGNYVSGGSISNAANFGGILGNALYSGNTIISCYSNVQVNAAERNRGTIYGLNGNNPNNITVVESYYNGGEILSFNDILNPELKITNDELKAKMNNMNKAIEEAGGKYKYVVNTNVTIDKGAPLVFGTTTNN